jgi:hypothetical protein
MRRIRIGFVAALAFALLAMADSYAQNFENCQNMIGLYTTSTPTPLLSEARYDGTLPGQFTVYVVITNPFNDVTTQAPIVQIGGFEFHIVLPSGFLITNAQLPPNVFNFASAPTFFCSGSVAVTNNSAVLATLTLATFTGTDGLVYLAPVPSAPSIPGSLAFTDFGDNFQLVEAYPSSGDLSEPVFGIHMDVPYLGCGDDPPPDPVTYFTVTVEGGVNGIQSSEILATVDPNGTPDFDAALEIPLPAPPPADYVSVSFEHADWPLGPRFQQDTQDFFDVATDARTWPLLVETDQAGDVDLWFTALEPNDYEFGIYLRDTATGDLVNLRPSLHHTFATTGGTHRFDLIVGVGPIPALQPTSRSFEAGWSMVGLPLEPNEGAHMSQILHDPAPGLSYAFSYAPATGYELINAYAPASRLQPFWYATDVPFTWTYEGAINSQRIEIPLTQGWNIVGSPLWFSAPLEGLRVLWNSNELTWSDAVAAGLLSGALTGYDTAADAYVNTDTMAAWHAYWIAALVPGLELVFDWANYENLGAKSAGVAAAPVPMDGVWHTTLVLEDDSGSSRTVEFGVHPSATAGFDAAYDLPTPPPAPSGGSRLSFLHPEWDVACGSRFASDVRATDDGADDAWIGRIDVPSARTVTLRWSTSGWPAELDFQVYLPSENRVVTRSMRADTEVALDVGADGIDFVLRSPQHISGVNDTPSARTELTVRPNPFNPQAVIAFEMPRPGVAEVRVYSVRGELVATLPGGVLDAGPGELVWRGKDRQGRDVPSGSYFARLRIGGEPVGKVVKMSLVR